MKTTAVLNDFYKIVCFMSNTIRYLIRSQPANVKHTTTTNRDDQTSSYNKSCSVQKIPQESILLWFHTETDVKACMPTSVGTHTNYRAYAQRMKGLQIILKHAHQDSLFFN